MRRVLFALLATVLFTGCAERNVFAPEDVGVLVVDAVMIVGEPFPSVYLSRTADPRDPASVEHLGEAGATVAVTWNTGVNRSMAYNSLSSAPGSYVPAGPSLLVQPETRYVLEIVTRAGERLVAETVTPPAFEVDDWVVLDETTLEPTRRFKTFEDVGEDVYVENQIVYSQGLFEAQFQRPDVPAFQVALFSLDPGSDFVIDPEFFEEEDFQDLERIVSSPMFLGENGTLRLPWFAIYFEGRYLIKIFAVDRNWYDLARSVPEFGQSGAGFGGNAGDGFQRPIFHVEGGIGLFGSASMASNGFYILPGTP